MARPGARQQDAQEIPHELSGEGDQDIQLSRHEPPVPLDVATRADTRSLEHMDRQTNTRLRNNIAERRRVAVARHNTIINESVQVVNALANRECHFGAAPSAVYFLRPLMDSILIVLVNVNGVRK